MFNPTPTFDSCIYRPGGTSGGDVFATWAEVKTFIQSSSNGKCIVYIDDSITSPAPVDAATGVTQCNGRVELRSFAAHSAILLIQAGATLDNLWALTGIEIRCQTTTATPALSITQAAGGSVGQLIMKEFGFVSNDATATQPALVVPAGQSIQLSLNEGDLILNAPSVPLISVPGTSTLAIFAVDGCEIAEAFASGAGNVFLDYDNASGSQFTTPNVPPALPGITGTYQAVNLDAVLPNPGPQSQATWFIDPQNVTGLASDDNSGIDVTHPVLSYNFGVARKWTTYSPTLRQDTVLTWLSSATDDSDPVVFEPIMVNAVASIQGVLGAAQQVGSGALATVVPKNRTTAQLLQADLGAAFAIGTLLHNTTGGKDSYAWVYALVTGTTYTLTQPLTPTTVPFGLNEAISLAEVDSWANGDTFVAYKPVDVMIAKLNGTIAEFVATAFDFPQQIQTLHINLFSPNGAGNDDTFLGNGITLLETRADTVISEQGLADDNAWFRVNIFASQGFTSAVPGAALITAFGGAFMGVIPIEASSFSFDYDVIIAPGGPTSNSILNSVYVSSSMGFVYLDVGVTSLLGIWDCVQGTSGAHASPTTIWGPGTLNVLGVSRIFYSAARGAVATFLVPTIMINQQANANAFNSATGLWSAPIAVTAANLDLAFMSGGFGGLAMNLGGGAITSQGTP